MAKNNKKIKNPQEKPAADASKKPDAQSSLFTPYRSVGLVSNHVPAVFQSRNGGRACYMTSCIGNSFHIYDVDKISLLFVGPFFDFNVVAVECHDDLTFVASNSEIIVCERSKETYRIKPKSSPDSSITYIQVYGALLVVAYADGWLHVWDYAQKTLSASVNVGFPIAFFMHPDTYTDKIVLFGAQGQMQLWNISRMQLVFDFGRASGDKSVFPHGIVTSAAQSPAVDVVALGCADGTIVMFNLRLNRTLFRLSQGASNRVTSVAFRTHTDAAHFASADACGSIYVWDLDEKRLLHVVAGAHAAAIHTLQFLGAGDVLMSVAGDNAAKQWTIDRASPPKVLKQRAGHAQQPACIRFYGDDGTSVLSGGRDGALRFFCLFRDEQNVEFSQRNPVDTPRLPPITAIASSTLKHKQWDNVVTAHVSQAYAVCWNFDAKAVGSHTLLTPDCAIVLCVCISACGNFAVLGTAAGTLHVFNMQSGILRRSAATNTTGASVVGVAVESSNRIACALLSNGTLQFLNFADLKPTGDAIHFASKASFLVRHASNDMLAVATDDFAVVLVDFVLQKAVRRFAGHASRITDVCFAPDGRWLVVASCDSCVRTWDIPSGLLIDCVRCASVPTSISFSPTGDYLLLAMADSVSISQWSNASHFSPVHYESLMENIKRMTIEAAADGLDALQNDDAIAPDHDFVTLSNVSKAKWSTLFNLQNIKARNKPVKPPSKPESAPFFLGSASSIAPAANASSSFFLTSEEKNSADTKGSFADASIYSPFLQLLSDSQNPQWAQNIDSYLKQATVSAIDFDIRSLPVEADFASLLAFCKFLQRKCEMKTEYELLHCYLHIFLAEHSPIVMSNWAAFAHVLQALVQQNDAILKSFDESLFVSLSLIDQSLAK